MFHNYRPFATVFGAAIFLLSNIQSFAQTCEISATVDQSILYCTECATLSATGLGLGQSVFSEDFNSGQPQGWAFTQQATFTNPCSPGGVDGTTHIWMGNQSPVPRALETLSYDFSTATAGATICFDMLFATQGNNAPCEGPDEPDEGVYLQYSTDNGATWTTIHYFDPNGGNDPNLTNWNNWCFPLPQAALTANTKIRWFQDNDSGADYDHWGIDNVNINFNDPTYEITWLHDNYSYGQGSTGGANPNPVCPTESMDYVVQISNGTNTCYDTVSVVVKPSYVEAFAGNDTTLCNGACVLLDGQGRVVLSPGDTATFTNAETATVVGFPAFPPIIPTGQAQLTMNVNVTGLNMQTISNGSISEVCFNLNMQPPLPGFPPGDVGIFDIRLICPSGDSITLVFTGTTSGSEYNQTCFVPAGNSIVNASSPYTGGYNPAQSFNGLSGCLAEGVWTLRFYGEITGAQLPIGFFNGWSITFIDPAVEGNAAVSWNPNSDIVSGATTDTPTICPTTTTTYTMTVTDQTGCANPPTLTDEVTIMVNNLCCPAMIQNISSTEAFCGTSDGTISITATGGTGTLQYSIDSGTTFQADSNFFGIPAGIYHVVVTDSVNCTTAALTVIITNSNGASLAYTSSFPSCAGGDGSFIIFPTGGTPPFQYSIDNGTTFQPDSNFTGLDAGTYEVLAEDANNCFSIVNITLDAPSTPRLSIATTHPSCGTDNGEINISTVGGNSDLSYSIDGGTTEQDSGQFTGLSDGGYSIWVSDTNGCTTMDSVTLVDAGAVTVADSIAPDTCGSSVGIIELNVNGNAPFTYMWSHDAALNGPVASGLADGTYTVTITDADNCPNEFTFEVPCIDDGEFYLNIPDGFTPNSDGNNEFFTVFGKGITEYDIQIFNRWGEQVYASNNLNELGNMNAGWDGTFKGKEQNAAVYVYFVRVVDTEGNKVEKQGNLVLIR